jgi:hypothetical protein
MERTMNQVRDYILRNATDQELTEIIDYVRMRRQMLSKQTVRTLSKGANVSFVSSRTGQTVTGTVESIKIKNVIVATALGRYKVPANMLTVN